MSESTPGLSRRQLIEKTGAALAAGFTIVRPESVRGSQANSKIAVGLIGVGGTFGNVVRVQPPLVIGEEELDRFEGAGVERVYLQFLDLDDLEHFDLVYEVLASGS